MHVATKDMEVGARRRRAGPSRPRSGTSGRSRGLRWVPGPLAVLAAVLGWLLLGSLPGHASAHQHVHGYQAGGLSLTVDQMGWMSNDMTGNGPVQIPEGFPMDPGMMPGMQAPGDNRLRVEVDLQNVSTTVKRYAMSDFQVVAPGGQSWKYSDDGGNDAVSTGELQPGFRATVDLYFDIPAKQSSNLVVTWSRNGDTERIPVDVSGVPAQHTH